MSANDPASIHRMKAVWSAIAGALLLAVAIFGMHLWDWRRTLCLVAGLLNVALSIQQYRKAKSALR